MTTLDRSYICPVLIGRAAQLQVLERAIEEAKQGDLSAVLLAGEAGIGKSRLAREALSRASSEGFLILRGDCFQNGASVPYSAILEMLRTYLSGRSPDDIEQDLGAEAAEMLKLLPELALVLPARTPSAALDAEQEKRRLFHALRRILLRLAGRQPLLVLFEDLHWSDETTLEFLEFLSRHAGSRRSARG